MIDPITREIVQNALAAAADPGGSSGEVLQQGKPDLLLETLERTERIWQLLS